MIYEGKVIHVKKQQVAAQSGTPQLLLFLGIRGLVNESQARKILLATLVNMSQESQDEFCTFAAVFSVATIEHQ